MTTGQKIARRAVRIAAETMQENGLCRYDGSRGCRRTFPPTEKDCVHCIERWLLNKAKKQIEKEDKTQ